MEACSSTTSNQKPRPRRRPEGGRPIRTEFEIINEKLRSIHCPLVDIPSIQYEKKFLGRHRLYIGNISNSVSKEDLENIFKEFGEVHDVFIQPNKNFGFVRMDYFHNALKAKQQLHGTALKDRKVHITFSPQASITVKHLSPFVSNELLHVAFAVFGEIEFCFIVTDRRGKSTGEGVVDFVKKSSAVAAKKYCNEHLFFVTSSLRPITVEDYVPPTDMDGLPEETIRKTHALYEERELGPRFALPGSFEYEYAQRYKELWERYDMKINRLRADQESEEQKLEIDLMRARYDHETERLKDMIRQRELEKERYCQKLEDQARQPKRMDSNNMLDEPSKLEFNPPENLFMHANQLTDILDNEERKIQEEWRMAEYRSDYDMGGYQSESFNEHNKSRRKMPEVIVHCPKRQRFSK